jgi:hypothetical protein
MNEMQFYLAIKETAQELTPATISYPPYLNRVVQIFEKTYFYFQYFHLYTLFQRMPHSHQGNNPLIYSVAMHQLSQRSSKIKFFIQLGLAIQCVEDLVDQHVKVYRAFQASLNLLQNRYPSKETHQLDSLEASLIDQYQKKWLKFKRLIIKVIIYSLRLLKEMFKLAMLYQEITFIIKQDSQVNFLIFTKTIVRIGIYYNKIIENQQFLKEELEKKEELVTLLLTKLYYAEATTNWTSLKNNLNPISHPTAQVINTLLHARYELFGQPNKIHQPLELLFHYPNEEIEPIQSLGSHPFWRGSKDCSLKKSSTIRSVFTFSWRSFPLR